MVSLGANESDAGAVNTWPLRERSRKNAIRGGGGTVPTAKPYAIYNFLFDFLLRSYCFARRAVFCSPPCQPFGYDVPVCLVKCAQNVHTHTHTISMATATTLTLQHLGNFRATTTRTKQNGRRRESRQPQPNQRPQQTCQPKQCLSKLPSVCLTIGRWSTAYRRHAEHNVAGERESE